VKHSPHITPNVEVHHDSSPDGLLLLDLAGPLRLTDARGADVTPTLRKGQGLLALVGTSPGLRRSRTWLQDKLWSDRGPTQGAASLRQCLCRLRAAMGKHADCLKAGPNWIALDSARVHVRTHSHAADHDGHVEFLEGLDIGDPEFEDWLRDQRLFYAERSRKIATRTLEGPVEKLHPTKTSLAGHSDPEQIGVMVAAAALAGCLLQLRERAQSNRLGHADLLAALCGKHIAHAHEIATALSAFLATHRREACDHGPALRGH
jgi:hypothetical protein